MHKILPLPIPSINSASTFGIPSACKEEIKNSDQKIISFLLVLIGADTISTISPKKKLRGKSTVAIVLLRFRLNTKS